MVELNVLKVQSAAVAQCWAVCYKWHPEDMSMISQVSASILLCRLHEVIQSDGSMHLPGLGVVLRGSGFSRLQ